MLWPVIPTWRSRQPAPVGHLPRRRQLRTQRAEQGLEVLVVAGLESHAHPDDHLGVGQQLVVLP